MKYPNTFHVEIMRLVVKATRRGDIAQVERLTRIAERLHSMMIRNGVATDRAHKAYEERQLRIAALKQARSR